MAPFCSYVISPHPNFLLIWLAVFCKYGNWMTFLPNPIRYFSELPNVSFRLGLLNYRKLTYPEDDLRCDKKTPIVLLFQCFYVMSHICISCTIQQAVYGVNKKFFFLYQSYGTIFL